MAHPDGHPVTEDLAALALGDAADVGSGVRRHVLGCATCRRQVEQLAEFADLARSSADPLVAPPDSVWAAISAATGRDETAARPPVPARRGVPARWVVAVAAVALLVGSGVGWLVSRTDEPDAQVIATTTLAALTDDADLGSAQVVSTSGHTDLRVRMTAPPSSPDTLREVWLLNADGRRMVSLGLMQSGDDGVFALPSRLLDQGYRTVDVSLEPDDGDPTHSGDSIARGTLAAG